MNWDAVVVGAGPNGLSAAITLAAEGLSTLLVEANGQVGGSARTEPLTLAGFQHDVGSAVYPMGVGSPFFASLPLEQHGLSWVHPDVPVAHPLDGGRCAALHRSLGETADALAADGPAYRALVEPFVEAWPTFTRHVLDTPFRMPDAPLLMARFAARALRPTHRLAARFETEEARALLAGNAAHAGTPLDSFPPSAVGLTLTIAAHAVGWPVPRGGAGAITQALAMHFRSLGGTIITDEPVDTLDALPQARAVVLALTPAQIARVGGDRLPARYREKLERWRYGVGAFKVDWALESPIPWTAEICRRAGTVHVGGTFDEVARSEKRAARGEAPDRPFVLVAQPSLFDPTRAPEGRHTAWAYCHVPNGWPGDASAAIEAQIERFAPGFRDTVLARRTHATFELESWNANLVGGDVNGGALTARQWFGPGRWTLRPWSTPVPHLYACSAATPPGGGVHGMCGYHAGLAALRESFGIRRVPVFGSGP